MHIYNNFIILSRKLGVFSGFLEALIILDFLAFESDVCRRQILGFFSLRDRLYTADYSLHTSDSDV